MKIVHPEISAGFTDEYINILVVENAEMFRELCKDLHDAESGGGKFVLSDGDKTLNIAKCGLIIADPTSIELDGKRLVTSFRAEFAEIAENEFTGEFADIVERISKLFDKVNSECSVSAEWGGELSAETLVKAIGVTPSSEDGGFLDRLITYISAHVNLLGVRFVGFVNLKSYLNDNERTELYKFLRYNGVLTLSIESFALPKSPDEFTVVIDKDLCEIVV